VQPAYKIDTSLVNPLGFLPEFSQPATPLTPPLTVDQLQSKPADPQHPDLNPANLAQRNLLRGLAMALPSGQSVAQAMGITPLKDRELRVGKAVFKEFENSPTIDSVDAGFVGNAPLWFYVLAEAQHEWFQRAKASGTKDEEPVRLGTVGGRIVAETLIGLILGDSESYLRQAPNWRPTRFGDIGGLLQFALNL